MREPTRAGVDNPNRAVSGIAGFAPQPRLDTVQGCVRTVLLPQPPERQSLGVVTFVAEDIQRELIAVEVAYPVHGVLPNLNAMSRSQPSQ